MKDKSPVSLDTLLLNSSHTSPPSQRPICELTQTCLRSIRILGHISLDIVTLYAHTLFEDVERVHRTASLVDRLYF